jgi:hypothetical protein
MGTTQGNELSYAKQEGEAYDDREGIVLGSRTNRDV